MTYTTRRRLGNGMPGAPAALLLLLLLTATARALLPSLSCRLEPPFFGVVGATGTNERKNHIIGNKVSSTSTAFTRPSSSHAATATIPPPPTIPKSPSTSFNATNTATDSAGAAVVCTVDGGTAIIDESPSTIVRNDNGTEMYYMTAAEDEKKQIQASPPPKPTTTRPSNLDSSIQQRRQRQLVSGDSSLLVPSMMVGVLSAAVGFGYVRVLGHCRSFLWKTLPEFLFLRNHNNFMPSIPPVLFIASMTTAGGALLGYATHLFYQSTQRDVYTASDFVSILSRYENDNPDADASSSPSSSSNFLLPSARQHLLPLLGMCLLTSACGIPLGPEAPMVGAGTLIGAAVAHYLTSRRRNRDNNSGNDTTMKESKQQQQPSKKKQDHELEQVLAYAGAAGALTGAMGIPIVGSIFALEMVQSGAGMSPAAVSKALSPSIVASLVAIVVLKLLWAPSSFIGGHFDYLVPPGSSGAAGAVLNHAITGRAMILTAVASGLGGSLLGTAFHKLYAITKKQLWTQQPSSKEVNGSSNTNANNNNIFAIFKQRKVVVRVCIGLLIGLIATLYPQSLFWGEGAFQSYIDGQQTPFGQTHHGLPSFLYQAAAVNPSQPYGSSWAALQVAVARFAAIVLAGAGKFSGGIVFPLFAAAPAFAHVFAPWLSGIGHGRLVPIAVMCTMAATQASATRTPLASALILALSASASTELGVLLPACLISSYLSIYASKWLSKDSYFHYHEEE